MKAVLTVFVMLLVVMLYGTSTNAQTLEQTPTGFYYPTGVFVDENTNSYAIWLAHGVDYPNCDCYHIGWDIVASLGDPVYAIADGEILNVSQGGWDDDETGNNVGLLIRHTLTDGTEFVALYGHVRSDLVDGDEVIAGQQIAIIGPWSPVHLHFGVHPGGAMPPDPYGALPGVPTSPYNNWENPIDWIVQNTPGIFYSATSTIDPETPTYPPGLDYYPVDPGQVLPVEFIFNNTGTAYWTNDVTRSHYVELHSVNNNWTADEASNLKYNWLDANGVRIATTTGNVDPGGQGLYAFEILAPDAPGDYWLYTALYRPHTSDHFSEPGPVLHIRVNATEISGNVSGTLYAADSPYKVVGHLSVPSGQTLVIESGCEFIFQGHYKFVVNSGATLLAIGTETDYIRFTATDQNDGWHGIRFLSASSDSRLEYCVIEYGNAYPDAGWDHWGGGVFCYYSNPTITHCLVRFNKALVGITGGGGGIAMAHSSPVISGCTITDNQATRRGGGGILSYASSPLVKGNTISNNTSARHGGGMYVEYGSATVTGNMFTQNTAGYQGGGFKSRAANLTISENSFEQNQARGGGGVHVESGSVQMTNNLISNNRSVNAGNSAGAGMSLHSDLSGVVSGNKIFNNTVNGGGAVVGGGGIYCTAIQIEITGNDIYGNNGQFDGGGIYVNFGSKAYIHNNSIYNNTARYNSGGIEIRNSNPIIRFNSIYGNNGGLLNATPSYATINATSNWWGDPLGPLDASTGPPDYNADGLGNSVSDYVTYRPWLGYSPSVQELIAEAEDLLTADAIRELLTGGHISQGIAESIQLYFSEAFKLVKLVLSWPGSEFKLEVYRPDGSLLGQWQSTAPPLVTEFIVSDTGTWTCRVTAVDIPNDDYPYALVAGSQPLGLLSGTVRSASGDGISGITLDLYDDQGSMLSYTVSADTGYYTFNYLAPGSYEVTLITPLGRVADAESKVVSIASGEASLVDFTLTSLEIMPSQRSMGFWKHQVNVHLSGKGQAQVSLTYLSTYMDLIGEHFNSSFANPVTVFDVLQPADQADSLSTLQTLLTVNKKGTMNERAGQQLTALLLNVVSGKLGQADTSFSEDDLTVSQAITYCNTLITDTEPENDELAKDIAELINNGQVVPAGWIDLVTPNIAYKQADDEQLPTAFSLSQNYPNPFNPVTVISYSLPEATHVNVGIYNIVGQRVATLVSGTQTAGSYNISWDASDHSSGIYFYRITTGMNTESKKMILLK